MGDNISFLEENHTWELVERPTKKKILLNKWIYKVKIEFNEIFAPVIKLIFIRTILSILAEKDLHLEQFDVKIVFLHGDLEKEICMQ